jgi:hypothetical protein
MGGIDEELLMYEPRARRQGILNMHEYGIN